MSLVTAALEKLDADLAKCTEEVDALADGYVEWLVELKDQNVRLVQHSACASRASLSHAGPPRARQRRPRGGGRIWHGATCSARCPARRSSAPTRSRSLGATRNPTLKAPKSERPRRRKEKKMALAAVAEDEEEPMNQENADGLRANPPSARKGLSKRSSASSSSGRSSPSAGSKRKSAADEQEEEEGCEEEGRKRSRDATAGSTAVVHRDQLAEINAAAAAAKAAASSGAAPFAEPVATAASLSGADTVNELKATLEKQTVKQLKLELEKAGLDLKGKKSILVDRLAEHQLGAIAPKQRAAAEVQIGTMELDGPSATVAAECAVESFTLDPVASFEAELDSAELGPPPAAPAPVPPADDTSAPIITDVDVVPSAGATVAADAVEAVEDEGVGAREAWKEQERCEAKDEVPPASALAGVAEVPRAATAAEAAAGTTRSASQPTAGMPAASIRNLPEPPSVREAPAREQPVRGGGGGFVRGAVAAISSMFGGPVNGGPLSEPTEVAPKGSDAEYGPGGKEIEEIIRDIDNKMPQQKTPTRQPDVPASRLAPVAEEADATTAAPGRGAHAARAARPQGGGARKGGAARGDKA